MPEIIQGGVSAAARGALKKQLAEGNYRKGSNDWKVYLFGNRSGVFDGRVFGAPKSSDVGAFLDTNICCIDLPDPGRGENAWGEERLATFYNLVDRVKRERNSGTKMVVACVAGKNRSIAVKRAIEPELCPEKPECEAMCRAVEGYHRDRDMSLAPLAPKPAKRSRAQSLVS